MHDRQVCSPGTESQPQSPLGVFKDPQSKLLSTLPAQGSPVSFAGANSLYIERPPQEGWEEPGGWSRRMTEGLGLEGGALGSCSG